MIKINKVKKENDFLVFGKPLITTQEIDEVVSSLRSGWLGTGPKVARFENMFREYKKAKYAIALNSCTAALHLSMLSIGIKPGDEVILPTMTFAATANAVIHAGGRPVFCDCEKSTMNIDPADIERKITKKTKLILPVHFAGRPCDMKKIMGIARKYRLKVIEDCAHAIEGKYHGKGTGTFGNLGCFSFYVTKNITTGEGGMVITDNKEYADRIKILALHGLNKDAWKRFGDSGYKHYQVIDAGFKYNLTDIQAAIGIHQLSKIEKYWKIRRAIWDQYRQALRDLPVFLPVKEAANNKHAYHLYTILLKTEDLGFSRDVFLDKMTKQDIGVGVHYVALHLHPYYQKKYGYRKGDFPNSEWISERTVSIPLSPGLSNNDVKRVVRAVKNCFA